MQAIFRLILVLALGFGLASCGGKHRGYTGPKVTEVRVYKGARTMALLHDDKVLKSYPIGLGFAPVGHKQFEGDGKTPEGSYAINFKNPNSQYHLSLMISYPNQMDYAFAESQGRKPGGEIFIHGGPKGKVDRKDWTAGCIAVTDEQIERIYEMVEPGTPINIYP